MHIPPFDNNNKPIVDMDDKNVPLNYFNIVKLNKDQSFDLDLNPDILELVSKSNKKPKIVVGFAAESENLFDNARSKLEKKGCDLIVANDVSNLGGTQGTSDEAKELSISFAF